MCDIVVKKFTFAISSPDEFLLLYDMLWLYAPALYVSPKPYSPIADNIAESQAG